MEYYNYYSANAHRGDYDIGFKVDEMITRTRYLVSEFIGAKENEIAFTNNTTDSLNKIILGFFENYLSDGDEVLLTKSEHASNLLPWFELKKRKNIVINYIPLDEDLMVTVENVRRSITPKTKVISIAHVTNVVGDERPIKEICSLAHDNNILVVCDGAQSVPHIKINVKDLDVDFLAFSAHKMLGPTGVGILYGKEELLTKFKPLIVGGGMNVTFSSDGNVTYSDIPFYFEAGSPNVAGIIAFGNSIKYLNEIGMEKIEDHVLNLRQYAVSKLEEIEDIKIYNKNINTSIITFNYNGISSTDLALYLNEHNICVRAGTHCAKVLKDELGINDTCRVSLYLYNNKEEIDYLIQTLKNITY